ncbi:hypothetical protein [Desulfopila sp. IMCC35008]|uniref:hypothetical protein n=1 Tax=Desulfopila sp. IMCC35008 TaxID=2653858 RepID=UPI0013D6C3F3|nr:hypothetical protein [Desulfopila sp. IMCC35008]
MTNAIINGVLQGIAGGAKAQQSELVKDAAELRRESYAKLLQEHRLDDHEFLNRLGIQRDEITHNRNAKRADELWDKNTEREDTVYKRGKEDAKEFATFQNNMKDKRGQYGKMYDDLARVFGDEKAKGIIQASMSKQNSGGSLSAKEKAGLKKDAYEVATSEMQMDIARAESSEEKQRISATIKKRVDQLYSEWTGDETSGGSEFASGLINEATGAQDGSGGWDKFFGNIKTIFGDREEQLQEAAGHSTEVAASEKSSHTPNKTVGELRPGGNSPLASWYDRVSKHSPEEKNKLADAKRERLKKNILKMMSPQQRQAFYQLSEEDRGAYLEKILATRKG